MCVGTVRIPKLCKLFPSVTHLCLESARSNYAALTAGERTETWLCSSFQFVYTFYPITRMLVKQKWDIFCIFKSFLYEEEWQSRFNSWLCGIVWILPTMPRLQPKLQVSAPLFSSVLPCKKSMLDIPLPQMSQQWNGISYFSNVGDFLTLPKYIVMGR